MKYHTTANTLPIYNFQQILNTNDLRYLYVVKFTEGEQLPVKPRAYDFIMLSNAWDSIQKELPQNTEYNEVLTLERSKAILIAKKVLTDEKTDRKTYYYYVNQIAQLEFEINNAISVLKKDTNSEKKEANLLPFMIAINSKLRLNMDFYTTGIIEFIEAEKIYTEIVESEKKQYEEMKNKNKKR